MALSPYDALLRTPDNANPAWADAQIPLNSYANQTSLMGDAGARSLQYAGYNNLQRFGNSWDNLFNAFSSGQRFNPVYGYYITGQTNNPLLQAYANAAGLNFGQGQGQPQGTPPMPGQKAAQTLNAQAALTPGGALAGNRLREPAPVMQTPAPPPMSNQGLASGAMAQQLNQEIDRINTAKQNALREYRASAMQSGRPFNPRVEEMVAQRFDAMANETRSNMLEQNRREQMQAYANLIGMGNQAYNANQSNLGDAVQALLALGQLGTSQTATSGEQWRAKESLARNVEDAKTGLFLNEAGGLANFIAMAASGGFNRKKA